MKIAQQCTKSLSKEKHENKIANSKFNQWMKFSITTKLQYTPYLHISNKIPTFYVLKLIYHNS